MLAAGVTGVERWRCCCRLSWRREDADCRCCSIQLQVVLRLARLQHSASIIRDTSTDGAVPASAVLSVPAAAVRVGARTWWRRRTRGVAVPVVCRAWRDSAGCRLVFHTSPATASNSTTVGRQPTAAQRHLLQRQRRVARNPQPAERRQRHDRRGRRPRSGPVGYSSIIRDFVRFWSAVSKKRKKNRKRLSKFPFSQRQFSLFSILIKIYYDLGIGWRTITLIDRWWSPWSSGLWACYYFYVFTFFKMQKTWRFTYFCHMFHTFSRTM